MKKFLALLACIAMLFTTVGCGKNKKSDKSISSTKDSSVESGADDILKSESTSVTDVDVKSTKHSDSIVEIFLSSIADKNITGISKVSSGLISKPFDDLLGKSKITKYTYALADDKYINYSWDFSQSPFHYYDVTITSTEDTSPFFKKGENRWVLAINESSVILFTPAGEFINQNMFKDNTDALSLVFHYQLFKDNYSVNFNSLLSEDKDMLCSVAGIIYNFANNYNNKPINADVLNKYITQTYGFSDFDCKQSSFYDRQTGNVSNYMTNNFLETRQVNSITKINSSDCIISVNYYIDELMTIKSRTIEYTVSYLPNNNYNIINTKTIYEYTLQD